MTTRIGIFAIGMAAIVAGCGEKSSNRRILESSNRPADIYVSPTGCDTNLGTRTAPLKTLEAAREAVRRLKKVEKRGGGGQRNVSNSTVQPSTSNLQPPLTICLLDGEYNLERPLALGPQDSDVVWCAENRGKAVLSGGAKLDWRKPGKAEQDRLALLPAVARDKVLVAAIPGTGKIPSFLRGNQLATPSNDIPIDVFSPKGRLTCARWPNDREAITDRIYDTHTIGVDPKVAARWTAEPDMWVFGLWSHDWIELHTPFRVVDAAKGIVAYPPEHVCALSSKMAYARPFHVYNAFAELDRPGEWVVDRARRQLWLWPEDEVEKRGGGGDVEVAIGAGLVEARGLSDVTFDGLVFERCRQTVVYVTDSKRVKVVASTFRDTCSWGVEVHRGSDCRVEGCDFYRLGEGGVWLEGGELKTLTPANHAAVNCHFHHLGKILFNYRAAVRLTGVGNRAEHNLIHHLRHAGILFDGNDHYIGWNVLHDVVDNYDAGAIYSWQNSWIHRGGVIEHNLVHVSGKTPNPTTTMGIYLDDHTSDVDVRYNIVDYASQGFMNGGGQCNRWYGNVVLNSSMAGNIDARGGGDRLMAEVTNATSVCHGAVWKRRYPNLLRFLGMKEPISTWGAGLVMTNNLFVSCGPIRNLDSPGSASRLADTVILRDNAELPGDPGFVDYANFDWRAKRTSPYKDIIDGCAFEKMGLFESDLRASPAVKFGPDMTPAFKLGEPPKDAPESEIWVEFRPLDKARKCAKDCTFCCVIDWGDPSIRSKATIDLSPDRPWRSYRFDFTPECDFTAEFKFGGDAGVSTEYCNVRIAGADVERPMGDKAFFGKAKSETKFKTNVKKDVPVSVTYEARRGE